MNPFLLNRRGIGGTQIPGPQDQFGQMVMNAQALNSQMTPMGPTQRPQLASPQLQNRQLQGMADRGMLQANIVPSGGVRPGEAPAMNAVQAARAQGLGGPPPGMAGRDPKDPRNAALAGYR
jgi:hypothetical protein